MTQLCFDMYNDYPWIGNFWKSNKLPWQNNYAVPQQYVDTINFALADYHAIFIPKSVRGKRGLEMRTMHSITFESTEHKNWFLLKWQ